jgi:hypothetical protein
LHKNKDLLGINHQQLSKDSAICRNKIVLEHVVASRNMREWRDQAMAELHQERRETEQAENKGKVQRIANG